MAVGEMVGVLLPTGDWVALRVEEVVGDACGDGVGVKRATLRTRLVSHSVVKRLPTGSMVRPLVLAKRACVRHAPLLLPEEPLPASVPTTPAGVSVRMFANSPTKARPPAEAGSNTMVCGPLKVAAAPVPSAVPPTWLKEPARCSTRPSVTKLLATLGFTVRTR